MASTFTPPRPDQWEGAAESKPFVPPPVDSWQGEAPASWSAMNGKQEKPRIGGQKVLDYATGTLSNIPGSAAKLAGNIAHSVAHPIDTAGNLLKVAGGTFEKMTPDTPTHSGRELVPYADAAGKSLKDRYGSPSAIADTIRTDPVGAAADASFVAGGVSGLARGAGAVADLASLPRVASGASKVADTAAAISDAVNPIRLATKPVGAFTKAGGKGFAKSALQLPGKSERYGATPATAVLEQTSGIFPTAIRDSAVAQLSDLGAELERLAKSSGNKADLTSARQVIADAIAKVKGDNGKVDDLLPMQEQLTSARPGFAGAVDPGTGGQVSALQAPTHFLGMKRQFGDDYTKFDAAVPLKDSARKVGNQAYHEMAQEFNRAVPGAQPINQQIQSLIPVKDAAQRVSEHAGPVQTAINRATRPTGAMAATLFGLHEAGVPGALAAMALQEGLANPAVKMGIARMLYGSGKAIGSPITSRTINTLGVEGEASDGSIPHYAKGGVAGLDGPEIALVGEEGPEQITPLTAQQPTVPEQPGTIAHQVHQLSSGVRRVVMLPRGTTPISTFQDRHGNQFLFNPRMISRNDIHAAVKTNNLPKILGASHGGMGVPDKAQIRGPVASVTGKTKSGIPTQDTVTDRQHLPSAIRQTKKLTPRSGSVKITSPSSVIADRLASPGPVL